MFNGSIYYVLYWQILRFYLVGQKYEHWSSPQCRGSGVWMEVPHTAGKVTIILVFVYNVRCLPFLPKSVLTSREIKSLRVCIICVQLILQLAMQRHVCDVHTIQTLVFMWHYFRSLDDMKHDNNVSYLELSREGELFMSMSTSVNMLFSKWKLKVLYL